MAVLNQPIKDANGNVIGYASGATAADANNISAAITSAHLDPTATQQPYYTPSPTATYPVSTLDTSIPTPTPLTPAQTEAQGLTGTLKQLNDSLIGKSADQTAAEAAAGIPGLNETITDLSSQLTGLQNQAKAIPLSLQNESEGRGITAGGLAPISSAALRDNATQALTVSTLLDAAKGNLSTAQAKADAAVAAKYGPIQEQITAATANLNLILNSPEYTQEEKAQAQSQLDAQNAKQAVLDKQKADASTINTTAITAASYIGNFKATADYPSAATALNAISNASTPAQAQSIATATGLTKPADVSTQVVETNGRKQLIDSKTGAVIKDLGAAPAAAATGTAAERASQSISNYSSKFVPGATLANGTPIIDQNGYITPAAFKAAIADAPANGLSREDFLKAFGYLLYAPGNVVSPAYGITPAEQKIVVGAASS